MGRASSRAAGERVFAIANFAFKSLLFPAGGNQKKDCFGATPKPARKARALPRGADRLSLFIAVDPGGSGDLFGTGRSRLGTGSFSCREGAAYGCKH